MLKENVIIGITQVKYLHRQFAMRECTAPQRIFKQRLSIKTTNNRRPNLASHQYGGYHFYYKTIINKFMPLNKWAMTDFGRPKVRHYV